MTENSNQDESVKPWVVAEAEGPITLNTAFVIDQLDRMAGDAKVTEGVDDTGNPRTYVVGRWNGVTAENTSIKAQKNYFNFVLISENTASAISGATLWDYSDESKPSFAGSSDSQGKLSVFNASGSNKFRILARGFAVRDILLSEGEGELRIEENDPACFGGISGGGMSSIWTNESSGYTVQFTAFGLMRSAESLTALKTAPTQQYSLSKGYWLPRDATPALDDDGFQGLNTRPNQFRANGGRWDQPLEPYNGFRFPEPTRMFGRTLRGEDEFVLVG